VPNEVGMNYKFDRTCTKRGEISFFRLGTYHIYITVHFDDIGLLGESTLEG